MLVRVYGQEVERRTGRKPTAPESSYTNVAEWLARSNLKEDELRYCINCLLDEPRDNNLPLLPSKADGYLDRRSQDEDENTPWLTAADIPGADPGTAPLDWIPPPGWEKGPDGHAVRSKVGSPLPEGWVWGVDGKVHDTRRPPSPPKPAPREKYVLVRDDAKVAAAKAQVAELAKRDAEAKAAAAAPPPGAKS